ncbi:MAG: chromosomal replication initiator protein DnaA [Candidatus Tectimicrobiota bacterium]
MDYTFSNFVVGSSNRFAHAAALAVANAPAEAYNPLLIYGKTGLGKTHLLQAMTQYIQQRHPAWRTVYVSAEHFMRELLRALQQGRTGAFQEHYRRADVLLVDDVQFMVGREHTQEAFLYTFDALHEARKQIVLACDKAPQELAPLDVRLRSRLAAGLLTDIQAPDLDTRLAILTCKASERAILLPQEVAALVASRIHTNISDLEQGLTRIATYASLQAQAINMSLAETVLQQIGAERARVLTPPRIQQLVAQHFHLKVSELRSKKRHQSIILPRQIAMFLCRECTDASLPEIGRQFGGRDHTTVLYACSKIARLEETDENVAQQLAQLRRVLGQ